MKIKTPLPLFTLETEKAKVQTASGIRAQISLIDRAIAITVSRDF